MITFEKLDDSHQSLILAIQLSDIDITFASTPQAFLSDTDDSVERFVVKYDGEIVGFFKLDLHYSKTRNFCTEHDLGFRTFALDKRVQGRGLGTLCMKQLPTYLLQRHSNRAYVYLTVNCKNLGAKACYQNAGFEDTGKLYLEGPAGPQHIMRRRIFNIESTSR